MLGHCDVMHIKLPFTTFTTFDYFSSVQRKSEQIEGVGFFLGFFASLFFFC